MNIIPDVLITQIFPLLSLKDIHQLSLTELKMRKLCQNEQLWRTLFERDFPRSGLNNTSWSDFYIESHNCRKLIHTEFTGASITPNGITYAEYYHLLGTAKKATIVAHFDEQDKNWGNFYIIPKVTTLKSFLFDIQQRVNDNSDYKGDYEFSFSTFGSLFWMSLNKIGNKYTTRDSFRKGFTAQSVGWVFTGDPVKLTLTRGNSNFSFYLSDQMMNSCLLE